jgi:hypothetical protein
MELNEFLLTEDEIKKTHDDWVYDHENITCAGTLEKAIAKAQLAKVHPELAKLQVEINKVKQIAFQEENEIEQILGKVLGYPWYKDDLKNFPNATEKDGVCVGDGVPVSLAMEASNKIAKLQARIKDLEVMVRELEYTLKER